MRKNVVDLYRVDVEVRFKTLRGEDYVEKVRFQADETDTDKAISFGLAKNVNAPFVYRVTRTYKQRPRESSGWIEHRGIRLDISSYDYN